MRHLTLLPPSTMTSPSTGQSTSRAANPPVDTVPVEVDGALVTSGDTVTVTDNVPHLTPLSPSTMTCPSTSYPTPFSIYITHTHIPTPPADPVSADVIVPCELWMHSTLL